MNIYEIEKIRKLVKGLEWLLVFEIGFVLMFKMRYVYWLCKWVKFNVLNLFEMIKFIIK